MRNCSFRRETFLAAPCTIEQYRRSIENRRLYAGRISFGHLGQVTASALGGSTVNHRPMTSLIERRPFIYACRDAPRLHYVRKLTNE